MEAVNNVIVVRAKALGTTDTYTMLRPGIVYDFVIHATNAGAGTVTLLNGASPISGALDPNSTDNRSVRPVTGNTWTTEKELAAGDVLTFSVSAATLNYEAYAYIYPTPGYGA